MKRCMIVDDSSVIRKVAKRILGGPDLMIVEAANGQEALSVCASDMPDVIVVDGTLPDMAADDFIRKAVAIESPTKPSIAICVTEVDLPTIMRAKRAGAKGYILKPFNRAQLIERFRQLHAAA